MSNKYDVVAYVWPSYTGDEPRAYIFWDEEYGEWQTVKSAEKKFPEHNWPRKPLWGFVNEANPDIMEMEIETATRYGVNVFAYDWYWYDSRPFLEQCLDEGFLKARNKDKMRFFINFCNHNAGTFWNKNLSDRKERVVWNGFIPRYEFDKVVHRMISMYFTQSNYYKIDGCPVVTIHYLQNLVKGLGGIDETAEALNYFREETKKAGFPDLHLQLNLIGKTQNYTGIELFGDLDMKVALKKIRFDSATNYHLLAITDMNRNYEEIIPDVVKEWENYLSLPITYFPHVSVGWDNNPRTHGFRPLICKNNTPENFKKLLQEAKNYTDKHNLKTKFISINSWNEWTETSYLEPDDLNGYGYLEAIKEVFLDEEKK